MTDASQLQDAPGDWLEFIAKADTEWALIEEDEQRIRDEVLPFKEIAFQSPITHPQILVEQDVPIRMRDGVTLRADIFRPQSPGKYPVVLMRTPYDKQSSLDFSPAVMRNLAKRGYVAVIQDVRGKYASEGEFVPRHNEVNDGHDTVEWAANQEWCNGKVGMWGISYEGFTSLAAALSNAPHLSCVYPAMIGLKLFSFKNGVFGLQGRSAWLLWTQGRFNKNPLRIDFNHLPLHEIDDKAGYPSELFDALVTMDMERLRAAEIPFELSDLAGIKSRPYMVAGWYDELLKETLDNWPHLQKANPDAQLMIGPWHHNLMSMEEPTIGVLPTAEAEIRHYLEEMEQFFAVHLKGEPEPKADGPIKLFVMGENQWRFEQEWPLARARYTKFYLHSSGAAHRDLQNGLLKTSPPSEKEGQDQFIYDPQNPVAWPPSSDVWEYLHQMGSCREVEQREDVLVYSSEILAEDVEVTGSITVNLYAATDAEDTDFVVSLIDVHPDGHSQYLTSGIIRGRFKDSLENPRLLEPNRVYKFAFELVPTSNLFKKGHRIRMAISSSDFSRYPRNQNTAEPIGRTSNVKVAQQTIFHSDQYPSHVILPVIPRL